MAKFEITQDCSVEGTNITPYGSEMPNFHLTYHFHTYEVVEAVDEQEQFIEVGTTSGTFNDGSVYNGACRFFIPREYVRLVDEAIPLPPAPPEEAIPTQPETPIEILVIDGEPTTGSTPKTYSESTGASIKIDYQSIKEEKKNNNDGLKLGAFIVILFVIVIIWMFLANS
tara:strand:+ start:695 stop:1204 length:510 start_codon:yes stop_codon:yes gene_type:complete